ncbi:MAG: division/cell wall cluster transcriptional repressor MraZ [Spirochaetes bacterium RBG_16_49_21]|nr:MAG: division/cell wall cluster transcriptional repressor MraZ [Spirochaetes bacterium RBG_16_49_21]
MFMGEYHPTLDEKGRVSIPITLRKAFGEDYILNTLVLTYGFDQCIMAFREEDWTRFVREKLVPLPQSNPTNRNWIRHLMGGARDQELDRQGRILIPGSHLEYARIKNDITILGLNDRIEIWATEIYNQYRPDQDSLNALAGDLGI